jgi:hemerythrin
MEWKSEYSVGIPEIDEQHKQLFACIERLESAGDERQRELAVYFVIDELKEYVRVHFTVEEIVMRLFDYPDLEAHIAEHREFAARLMALGKIELVHDIHGQAGQFLRDWLLRHIMGSDQRYAAYLLRHGASLRT